MGWGVGLNFVKWLCSYENNTPSSQIYIRYLSKINTILSTILFAIKWAIFHLSITIIGKISCMCLLFILPLLHVVGSVGQLKNK